VLGSRSLRQVGVVRRGTAPVLPPTTGGEALIPPPPAATPRLTTPAPRTEEQRVDARLGRILAQAADVYRMPDPRSRWVAQLPGGHQVAITSQWQGWFAIVMTDGSQAYVPQTRVEVLPFQVLTVVQGPSSPATVTPTAPPPAPAPDEPSFGATASPLAQAIIEEALRYRGTPYVYGGNTASGIDCSGLVKNCFATQGVRLPRRASEQAQVGAAVPLGDLEPGDRLYFSVRRTFDHTGIYLGNGYFIHAALSRGKVTVDRLSTPLYSKNLAAARRF